MPLPLILAWILWFIIFQPAFAEMPVPGTAGAPADSRYCGEPARHPDGRIKRSETVLKKFADTWPCPANDEKTTSCPGWQIDHVVPLSMGGCDLGHNLQWLPDDIKTCAGDKCKDRWERHVYSPYRHGK